MASIRTNDGRLVDPFNPRPEDVRPKVMIHSLSQINRYTGQGDYPYSVGQHTINLYKLAPPYLRKAALVHDFAESWFNDLASPVKAECAEYKRAEHYAMMFIAQTLSVGIVPMTEIDWYDKAIYINERNALFSVIDTLGMGDDRRGLIKASPKMFVERNWRDVRTELSSLFIHEFGIEVFER